MTKYILLLLIILLAAEGSFAQQKSKKGKGAKTEQSFIDRTVSRELFIDGLKAGMLGNKEEAKKFFEACLEKDPGNDAAMFELAKICGDSQDMAGASGYIEKALEIAPANLWYRLLQINIYQAAGRNNDLLKSAQELVRQFPSNPDYLYELANACIVNGKTEEAIQALDQVEDILGVMEELSIQKQQLYMALGKSDKAAAEIEKLIINNPSEASRYYAMLAEVFMKSGDTDKAAGYYRKIVETDPANPYVHISLSDYYRNKGDLVQSFEELRKGFENPALDVETKIRIMLAYYSVQEIYNGKKKEAAELADIMLKTHPGDARAMSMKADLLLNDKDYSGARDLFRQVIAVDSSNYRVWENLLQAEASLFDMNALFTESTRATELFPFQPLPYLFSGMALVQLKRHEEAIKKLNAGVKLVVNNDRLKAEFYSSLGDAYNAMKEFSQSDDSYEKALKIDPNNSLVLNNYAYYSSLRGVNLDRAESMARKAVDLDPENPANMDTYGWVLFKLGKYAQARMWLEKAIVANAKEDPDLLEHLGDILYKLNDTENALHYWQRALDAGSQSATIRKKINDRKLYE